VRIRPADAEVNLFAFILSLETARRFDRSHVLADYFAFVTFFTLLSACFLSCDDVYRLYYYYFGRQARLHLRINCENNVNDAIIKYKGGHQY